MSPAEVLRKAADGYRTGQIEWGREWFHDPATDCRCALGAITWAVASNDEDGNPWFAGTVAWVPAVALADYLTNELGAPRCTTDGLFDPIETVGGFNDRPDMTVERIIAALDAAAERVAA